MSRDKTLGPVACIDFDGTLCQINWPLIGAPKQDVIDKVKELKRQGWQLVLHTCRCGIRLQEAIEWCTEQGIVFDSVNKNTAEVLAYWEVNDEGCSTKPSADLYVDDKCVHVSDFVAMNIEYKAIA